MTISCPLNIFHPVDYGISFPSVVNLTIWCHSSTTLTQPRYSLKLREKQIDLITLKQAISYF